MITNQQEDVSMIEGELPIAPTNDLANKPAMQQGKPDEKVQDDNRRNGRSATRS